MVIDITEYLKEIDHDNVCGDDLQYDPDFIELEQLVKGKPERQMGDTIVDAEPPNWREIRKYSENLLARSIDLRVLVIYLRALVSMHGFLGLADGLNLLKSIIELRWETIHPQLDPEDENDPTERINVLMSLCDYETLLKPLQQLPLVESKAIGRFNFREISIASGRSTATGGEKEVNQSAIDAAIQDSELVELQQTSKSLTDSLDYLNQLETLVTDYVGVSQAPSFLDLRTFLKDCKSFIKVGLERRGDGDEEKSPTIESIQDAVNAVVTKSISGVINNSQDVIKTLNLVCDYYKKHEPSSPVPFFIERALRLVGKNFMDALKDIAPTGIDEAGNILGQQNDEN